MTAEKLNALVSEFEKEISALPFAENDFDGKVTLANEVCERYHRRRNDIRIEAGLPPLEYGRG